MAQLFEIDHQDLNLFRAALTTGERLFLARIAGDIIELLGIEEERAAASDALPESPAAAERGSLEHLLASLGADESPETPQDPAILRLLPTASADAEVAQEFRRYTDDDLRQTKVNRLVRLSKLLLSVPPLAEDNVHVELTVTAAQAPEIAAALTDMRLVLAQRLEINSEEDSECIADLVEEEMTAAQQEQLDENEYRRYLLASLYAVTGYLLESLSDCLLTNFRAQKS